MPLWFILSLVAVILWAGVNLVDKYLVVDNESSEYPIGSLVLFSSLVGIFVCVLIILFTDNVFNVPVFDKIILFIAGIADVTWIILYLYALKYDDASSVVPWFLTVPVFSYFLGYFILNEKLNLGQILGGLVICLGAFVVSLQNMGGNKFRMKWKTIAYMLPAALISALWGVLFKFGAQNAGYWESSFWEYLGLGVSGIFIAIFVKKYRNGFLNMLKRGGKKILAINVSSEVVTIVGNLLTNFAFLMAPVALVYLLGAFQPVAVLVLSFIISRFFPRVIHEDFSKKVLFPKILAIAIMFVGSIFLFK